MSAGRRVHYLRENKVVRVPKLNIILDTESVALETSSGQEQSWRLGVALYLAQDGRRKDVRRMIRHTTPQELWNEVTRFCRPGRRTALWAHNLGYDLRISQALTVLPELGWELKAINLAGRGCWARFARGRASLMMMDTSSIWPCGLGDLARDLGMNKLDLPSTLTSNEGWYRRCERDVEILAAAVESYLAWIITADLGCLQPTGAGQSWAAYRHRFMRHRFLVHDNAEAIKAERRAMWAGRAEAYFIGRKPRTRLYEFDLERCYLRIAAEKEIPLKLRGPLGELDLDRYRTLRRTSAILAEVEVTTTTPVLPTENQGRVLWPTGTFRTTIWDPEIDLALEAGATVRILRAWAYSRAPALQEWAGWIDQQLVAGSDGPPPHLRRIIKHWSRALIGRFGLRYSSWETFGESSDDYFGIVMGADLETGEEFKHLRIGRKVLALGEVTEADSSLPQVTGYVMSEARARLWRIIQAVGAGDILYVDTDSVLVTSRGKQKIETLEGSLLPMGLRLKRSWQGFEIWGTRKLLLGREVRVAGLPKTAYHAGGGRFEGEIWASVGGSLHRGAGDRVNIANRTWQLRIGDNRRQLGSAGLTVPFTLPIVDHA